MLFPKNLRGDRNLIISKVLYSYEWQVCIIYIVSKDEQRPWKVEQKGERERNNDEVKGRERRKRDGGKRGMRG